MADFDEPNDELQRFLHEHASALDRNAASVSEQEARERVVTHSLEPSRRWIHTPAVVATSARRRPALAAAVIAALLVGSVGGFAAGRGSAPKHATVAARGAATDTRTPTPINGAAIAVGAGGGGGGAAFGGPGVTLTRLFIRTTAEGVAVRGYLQNNVVEPALNGVNSCAPNSWCPPPECNPTSFFMAELSSTEAVTQGGSPEYPLDGKPAAARGSTPLGEMEGAPVSTYLVQTSDAVSSVVGTWPDGFSDAMQPVNGWAIVAHSGSATVSRLEAILKDGSHAALDPAANTLPASCQPPPPPPPQLPPAGSEQPADIAAATQGVTDAYNYIFTHGNDPSNNGTYLEDANNLKAAGDKAKQNFQQASDTITVTVGEIHFLSSTDAALYFELKYEGGMLFGQQVGYARLIDGHWKVARDTMCMVLGWAGAQCDPPPDPARSTTGGSAPAPGTYNGPNGGAESSTASSSSAKTSTTAPN
jgi:hypothetical protein